MRYLTKHSDGNVSVITAFPVKIIRLSDGLEITALGQRRNDPKDGKAGECIIYGSVEVERQVEGGKEGEMETVLNSAQIVVGDENYDIGDLERDSIQDYEFEFPDIEKDIVAKWVPEVRDTVVSSRKLHKAELNTDRYFRKAWTDAGTKIKIDMTKAKELHKDNIRKAREPLFAALDADYMKADESNNKAEKTKIAAKKQTLRDVTALPAIDAAKTPEELKAIWPL